MKLDLSLLTVPPTWDTRATLWVEALAPLSMVAKLPGKYYRSQPAPTDGMLLGMLENALGWHIAEKHRAKLLKALAKKHKDAAQTSNVGFGSVLQWHIRIETCFVPPLMHYDDLWAQHLKGASFAGGSRNYDAAVIPLMNAVRAGHVTLADTGDALKDPNKIYSFESGDKIHLNVVRPYFPQYYASPTPREYVMPDGPYRFALSMSTALLPLLREACENPAAPLYLGSNDGWVEATLEEHV